MITTKNIRGKLVVGLFFMYSFARSEEPSRAKMIIHADRVIKESKVDFISASKQVEAIFLAAKHLYEIKQFERAKYYFHAGLQLAPWNLDQQLEYAKLLRDLGDSKEASAVAKIVFEGSERQKLLEESSKLCNLPMLSGVLQLPPKPIEEICFCFVRLGSVDEWLIQNSGEMLAETLGSPVFVHPQVIDLPKPHRSYYDRWVAKVKKDIKWEHPFVQAQMKELGVKSQKSVSIDVALEILARIMEAQGEGDHRDKLQLAQDQAMEQDQQWNAEKLFLALSRAIPERENVIYIGITKADIYGGNNNFLFGLAHAASRRALVSYARYSAIFNNERENKQRLLTRIHKQLLSSTGFALGIPRPTDPRSARSYPSNLADHDRKQIWLSDQCIKGFEKALEHQLPKKIKSIHPK